MKTQEEQIIHDFLKKVEEKLPAWLKDKREELKSVLTELEEHIWDKATELGKGTPDEGAIQAALAEMGAPDAIAREYKRRGTPKVYITEELWPSYTRVLLALVLVVVCVNVMSSIIEAITTGEWLYALDVSGILTGSTFVFVIVSLVFIGLSMQGYLPEDFKSKFLRGEKVPASPAQGSAPEKPQKFVHVAGEFIGGILNLVFGTILILLRSIFANIPVEGLAEALVPYEEYFLYIVALGIIVIICGIISLARSIAGNDPRTGPLHRKLRIANVIATFASISFLGLMLVHPELCPFIMVSIGSSTTFMIGIAPEFYYVYQQVFGVIIALTVLGGGIEIYKAVTLKP